MAKHASIKDYVEAGEKAARVIATAALTPEQHGYQNGVYDFIVNTPDTYLERKAFLKTAKPLGLGKAVTQEVRGYVRGWNEQLQALAKEIGGE